MTPRIFSGGGERVRTDGLLRARQALSQLSYTPLKVIVDFILTVEEYRTTFSLCIQSSIDKFQSSIACGGPSWN